MTLSIAPVIVLLAAAAPAEDPDVELFDYTVVEGDTCASISKKVFGSRKAYNKIHKHNRDMGPTPHKLKPGTILKLPREVKRPDATVTATERQVEARAPKDKSWKSAARGFELFRGWRVSTLERSFAEVTFRDTSRMYMRENTLVIIYGGNDGATRKSSTKAKLDRGALRSSLGALSGGKTLTVETPGSSTTSLEGGDALITVDEKGTARVANHGGGKASVKAKSGKKVVVPELMGSKVKKGKPPAPPVPLPPTPKWASDNAAQFLVPQGATGSLSGSWSTVEKAETYRVEVGRKAKGGYVTSASVVVPKTATRFEVHGIGEGEYFATVSAVDNDAFESPPSRLYESSVISAPLLSPSGDPLKVPAAKEGEPTAPVRVLPGAKLNAPNGLTCGLGDGPKSQTTIVMGNGLQRFQCEDAKGNAVPGFEVEILGIQIANAEAGAGEEARSFSVVRGQATTLKLDLQSEADLPESLSVKAPTGFEVGALERDGDAWTVTTTATKDASSGTFMLDNGGTTLGQFNVVVVEPEEAPPPATPDEPDKNMVELGIYGGFIAMSTNHELVTTESPLARDREIAPISPDFGVRFGYYPRRFFGFELEGGLMPTRLREGSDVMMFEARGSVVGQLPWRVTPYILLGGGITGLTSNPEVLGDDTDASLHFGGGVKFFATRYLAVRLGVRNVVLQSTKIGTSSSPQVLLGISGVLRRTSAGKKK